MPVLRAVTLDIGNGETHTVFMLSRRIGALLRILTLMGLVLVSAVVASEARAADEEILIYRESVDGTDVRFPYLSPIYDQRTMLLNTFTIQTKLFNAIGNPESGLSALKYLALAATLVGALLILFNPKHRRVPVVGAWLLLLIVCLFSPYGSRLLFYPLTKAEIQNIASGETKSVAQDCSDGDGLCGFTPQLAAIHVASVLQLTFADLFNSVDWNSLLDDVALRSSLERSSLLIASPEWPNKIQSYNRKCGISSRGSLDSVLASRVGQSTSSGSSSSTSNADSRVITFGEMWGRFSDTYRHSYGANTVLYPPQAIVLYDEQSPEYADWAVDKEKYVLGLNELYRQYVGEGKVVGDSTSQGFSESSNISIKEALDDLEKTPLFSVGERSLNGGVFPGFFITRRTSNGISNADEMAEYRRCYSRGAGCFQETGTVTLSDSVAGQQAYLGSVFSGSLRYQPSLQDLSVTNFIAPFITSYSYEPWRQLLDIADNSGSAVINMPVGVINYKLADLSSGRAAAPEIVEGTATTPVIDCAKEGNNIIDEGINWTLSSLGNAPEMEPLRKILVDTKSVSVDELTLDQLADPVVNGVEASKLLHCKEWWTYFAGATVFFESTTDACLDRLQSERDLANAIIKTYKAELNDLKVRMQKAGREITDQDRYKLLLTLVVGGIQSSTATYVPSSRAEAAAAAANQEIDIKENSGLLTYVGGGVAKFLGNIFLKVGSFFTGPLSATIVYFLSMFVDLALLSLIVMTPILFLISLAMPGAAIGVLTIAIMGAFILKAVPITLLMINALSRLVYMAIGGAQSANSEQLKELLTLAGAGLYANLIGLTFFLLFKLGDASAVLSRFTALDSSANKLAEAGWNATKALAMATVALPLVGGLGGAAGAHIGQRMLAKAGLGDVNSLMAASRKGVAENAPPKGKGGALKDTKGNILTDTKGKAFDGEQEEKILANEHNMTDAMHNFDLNENQAAELYGTGSVTDKLGNVLGLDDKSKPKFTSIADLSQTRAMKELGLKPEQAAELYTNGSYEDVLGNKYALNEDNVAIQTHKVDPSVQLPGTQLTAAEQNTVEAMQGGSGALGLSRSAPAAGTAAAAASEDGKTPAAGAEGAAPAVGGGEAAAPAVADNSAAPASAATGAPAASTGAPAASTGAPAASTGASVAGTGAPAAGVAAQVTIAGGHLTSVGSIESIGDEAKAAETLSPDQARQQQINKAVEEQEINQAAADVMKRKNDKAALEGNEAIQNNPQARAAVEALDVNDRNFEAKKAHILRMAGTTQGLEDAKQRKALNLSQQFADSVAAYETKYAKQFAAIEEKNRNGQSLDSFEKRLVASRDAMLKRDPAALALSEQAKALADVERLQASIDARYGADNAPSMMSGFLSGVYGSISGGGGGLAKIPVIGPMVGEALNEFYQAPERSRAMQSVGGFGSWWSAQGNAKRMGFYQKEMSPLAAGEQYNQMLAVGGFQAQSDIARQAAAEAVARSRTQWEGMLADRKMTLEGKMSVEDMGKLESSVRMTIDRDSLLANNSWARNEDSGIQNKNVDQLVESEVKYRVQQRLSKDAFDKGMTYSARDLAGIGRHDVAAKIGSLKSEAALVQTASLKVETVKGGLDSNMMVANANPDRVLDMRGVKTETSNIFLTPDALANLQGNIGVKAAGKRNDEMMVANYGIVEKQYLRGDSAWDSTRRMAFDRDAAGRFIATDIDTDYNVTGHLNMVQGKERFMDMRGQYESLVKYRSESNALISKHLSEELSKLAGGLPDLLKRAQIAPDSLAKYTGRDFEVMQRSALEKWSKNTLKGKGVTIPMEAIFDIASVGGNAKYEKKVMTAFYEVASQGADNWVAMQKAAAAMYADKFKDVKDFTRKMSVERKGIKYDIGSADKKLFENLNKTVGTKYQTQVDKVMVDYIEKNQKELVTTMSKSTGKALMAFTKSGWNGLLSEIQQKVGREASDLMRNELLKAGDTGNFWERGNYVAFGEIDANEGKSR